MRWAECSRGGRVRANASAYCCRRRGRRVVTFFALQAERRVPAMLNFSTGAASAIAACRGAEIKLVVTARTFIEKAKLEPLIAALEPHTTILYLEDVKREIGIRSRLSALMRSLARQARSPCGARQRSLRSFSSRQGRRARPRASCSAIATCWRTGYQLASVVDISPKDIVFNALPVFHSFGLTGGLLMPLLAGVRTFLYPSPLHYRTVPELVYGVNATILFGTDTFLSGYARVADNYDFYSVRYIFAGAERVKPETRRVWFEKFGIRILEGYGATETVAGAGREHADALQGGHRRPAAAGHRASPGARRGHRRRRPALRPWPERDARLPARREAWRARAAGRRLVRHRRHRRVRCRGVRDHQGAREALRESRGRDGAARRRRGFRRQALAASSSMRS